MDIEILPSSTAFLKGETLRVVVLGRDSYEPKVQGPVMRHGPLRNAGEHVLRTGARYDAHLLVPVVPTKQEGS